MAWGNSREAIFLDDEGLHIFLPSLGDACGLNFPRQCEATNPTKESGAVLELGI